MATVGHGPTLPPSGLLGAPQVVLGRGLSSRAAAAPPPPPSSPCHLRVRDRLTGSEREGISSRAATALCPPFTPLGSPSGEGWLIWAKPVRLSRQPLGDSGSELANLAPPKFTAPPVNSGRGLRWQHRDVSHFVTLGPLCASPSTVHFHSQAPLSQEPSAGASALPPRMSAWVALWREVDAASVTLG